MSVKGKEYQLAVRIAGMVDKSFGSSLGEAERSLNKTVAKLDSDFGKLDKGFAGIIGIGEKAFQALAAAAVVASTAIGAVTAASINVGMEFEQQMSAVQAISGATADELEDLTEIARELAQTSPFSASEVGEAMEYMGMAGWKTEQIIAGIGGVMDLAAASGEELAIVSDIVTDDLTAFHMEAEETARMVDVMAQTAMNSNTNIAMMGETFKYAGTVAGAMGYQIEDIAIATGLMANAGIKAGMSGTALRNIINRMAKPTKESAAAMKALGLSLERDDGSMYSFLEIMEQMREGMSGMTAAEKAYYAAGLAGTESMSGLLAIANSTDEQFAGLTEAIYNADGAAKEMAAIRLDNLAGDIQIFKDALADAGIEMYQDMNGPLRGLVQTGTELVNNVAAKIPKAMEKISTEFPTLQRKFKKFAQPVFSGIMEGGKWIVKHGNSIISVLAGIGTALAAYKAVSGITHLVSAITSLGALGPATLGIMGAVSAVGLLAGAYVDYKQREREMIDQNLAGYFGDITLSMEELQEVAKHILADENLGILNEAAGAFEGLDKIVAEINENVSALNRMNWKISIGMELTQEEMGTYRDEMDAFIANCQEYALQQQYAVTLSVQALINDENLEKTNIIDTINRFYADKQNELSRLGSELAEVITDAFADDLFEVEEMEQVIKLQQQMAEIQNALADSEFNAALTEMEYKYSGVELTPETIRNLMAELDEQKAANTEKYDEALRNALAQAELMKAEGYFEGDAAYREYTDQIYAGYLDRISKMDANILQFATNTVMNSGMLDDSVSQAWGILSDSINPAKVSFYVENYGENWMQALENELLQTSGLEDIDQLLYKSLFGRETIEVLGIPIPMSSIEGLMPGITSQRDELVALAEEYRSLGKDIPQWIEEGLGDYETVSFLGGSLTEYLMGLKLASDPELTKYLESTGAYIPERVAAGINGAGGEIEDAVIGMYETSLGSSAAVKDTIQKEVEELSSITQGFVDEYFGDLQAHVKMTVTLNNVLHKNGWSSWQLDGLKIDENADGGIIKSRELSWLAEKGPEAVIPLDGSRNAVALWEQTGQLLGMRGAFDDLDLDGGGITVEYNPILNFYGDAPSREDLVEALDISQDKFDSHMERYLKTRSRVSFG